MLTRKPKTSQSIIWLNLLFCLLFTISAGIGPALGKTITPDDWRVVGPIGGDVRALVVDPTNPDRFYFGTLDGQIYTSSDSGRKWSLLYNFNRPKMFIDNILVDSRDARVLYVGAHRHQEPGGFYKSQDGGHTWRENADLRKEAIYALEQSTKDPNLFLAGTNHGIFRSDDAGESWVALSTQSALGPTGLPGGLKNVESLAIDPTDTNILYAGTWFLPYKSTDGGQSWRIIKNGMIEDSDVFAIDIDRNEARHIIASACSGIYETRDGGENWKKIQGIPSSSRRTRAILQHPTIKGLIFAGTTEGFWRSQDGGASWMLMTSKALEINAIAVHPERPDDVYISTNNYGVMLARDAGKTFVPTNGGYSSRFTNTIVSDIERPNRFYSTTINTTTGGGFFFVSDDGGLTWQPSMRNMSNRVTGYAILQNPQDANTIYLGTNYGLYTSHDRGASWNYVSAPKAVTPAAKGKTTKKKTTATSRAASPTVTEPPAIAAVESSSNTAQGTRRRRVAVKKPVPAKKIPAVTPPVPTPVYLSEPVNSLAQTWDENGRAGILAATVSGLYRTFDAAKGGQLILYGGDLDKRTTAIWTSPRDPRMIWVGTVSSGLLLSQDGGATWQRVAGVPNEVPLTFIRQDEQRPERIYVGTKQTIYLSRDGGQTWMRRGGGLPFGEYYALTINPDNSDEVFVGNAFQNDLGGATTLNGGGIYRSTDAGLTWVRFDARDSNLPSQRIWALLFDPNTPGRLFVGSHSAGIYRVERNTRDAALSTLPGGN